MVSWTSLNTLIFPIGIWLFRNGPALYRSIRAPHRSTLIRSTPTEASRALNLLFCSIVVTLLFSLPFFTPPSVFQQTQSNLQTSTDVIFARLAAVRDLTSLDLALRSRLTAKNTRLVYLAYGPDVVGTCGFCSSSEPLSYFYYALPMLLAPHLWHLGMLGLATSPIFAGQEGARWRNFAVGAGLLLGAGDIYLHLNYDLNANSLAVTVADMDPFFWRMRQLRLLMFVLVDCLFAAVFWLASTNRFFVASATASQRLDNIVHALDVANFRLWATGNIRNTVARDGELRDDMARYWAQEREVYERREVIDATQSALQRTDMPALTQNAEQRANDILKALNT